MSKRIASPEITIGRSPILTVRRFRHTLSGVRLLTDFELLLSILASAGLLDAPKEARVRERRRKTKTTVS